MKSIKKVFTVLAVAMLMFSMVLATSYAVNVPSNEKQDIGTIIEPKKKTVSYKITWDANGGKIGTKKAITTSVKKGSKINKLVATPKLSGYTFKGWYTKKSSDTEITKNTKPNKNVTYYAQWTRKLTAEEKKLVGSYTYGSSSGGYWKYYNYNYNQWKGESTFFDAIDFKSDGTYESYSFAPGSNHYRGGSYIKTTGNWHIPVKCIVRLTNMVQDAQYKDGTKEVWFPSQYHNWTPNNNTDNEVALKHYLAASTNCQVNDVTIKALATELTNGPTSEWAKAESIFNYVKNTISYSFYYNTKYGAKNTLIQKTGNSVDQSHLLIALFRASGLASRYINGKTTFLAGGSTVGHVWVEVKVGDTWTITDVTSPMNSLGVIKNWNTNTATIYGKYASISF